MAILKLYGTGIATCTRRVAIVLNELKVPFELVQVDLMGGEQKTPAHLKFHPFGQIPVLDDDGFILYESRAIARYIAAKHPESGLIPTDPKAKALFEQAASVELNNFEPYATKAGLEFLWRSLGLPHDLANTKAPLEALDKKLDAYDAILAKQRFLARDSTQELTLADLFHFPYAELLESKTGIMTRKPNVARWYKEIASRPSWLAYQDGGVVSTTSY